MEIDWKFIATKCAYLGKFRYTGHDYISNHIILYYKGNRVAYAPKTLSQREALIYDFVLNVSKIPGLLDDKKVEKIIGFLREMKAATTEEIVDIFTKGKAAEYVTTLHANEPMLSGRQLHSKVIAVSKKLFDQGDYFHAVLEACKAFNKTVQNISGIAEDGTQLMFKAFGQNGKVLINTNKTTSEKDENDGYQKLAAGVMSAIRNPLAHENSTSQLFWDTKSPIECLEILGLLSFLFRKLDQKK